MSSLMDWLLTNLPIYGPLLLVVVAYVGSLGIPFPITMVIVAAGAFSRMGLIDWRWAMLACLVGAALADNSEYLLGRIAQPWLKRQLGRKGVWKAAQSTFNRQGGWAILLTRFWLTPLAPAVNVMAGSRYSYPRFLALDVIGQFFWVLIYGGLGYLFASQWEGVSQGLSTFNGISMALFFGVAGIYLLMLRRNNKNRKDENVNTYPIHGSDPCL
jgi:membrane-associated protein